MVEGWHQGELKVIFNVEIFAAVMLEICVQ